MVNIQRDLAIDYYLHDRLPGAGCHYFFCPLWSPSANIYRSDPNTSTRCINWSNDWTRIISSPAGTKNTNVNNHHGGTSTTNRRLNAREKSEGDEYQPGSSGSAKNDRATLAKRRIPLENIGRS
jgi:hypothetical protein